MLYAWLSSLAGLVKRRCGDGRLKAEVAEISVTRVVVRCILTYSADECMYEVNVDGALQRCNKVSLVKRC